VEYPQRALWLPISAIIHHLMIISKVLAAGADVAKRGGKRMTAVRRMNAA